MLPIQIKGKYYPWFLFILFTLFAGSPQLDLLAGMLLGYAHHYGLMSCTYLSSERAQHWEEGCLSALPHHKGTYLFIYLCIYIYSIGRYYIFRIC